MTGSRPPFGPALVHCFDCPSPTGCAQANRCKAGDSPRRIQDALGAPSGRFKGLTEAEAWIERRIGVLVTEEDYTPVKARTLATGEWHHHLAGLAAHDGARQVWEPRIFGRRLPLRVEQLLPEIVTERRAQIKTTRTTVTFPWDSRTYIWDRGDDTWWRFTFIGNKGFWAQVTRDGRKVDTEFGW